MRRSSGANSSGSAPPSGASILVVSNPLSSANARSRLSSTVLPTPRKPSSTRPLVGRRASTRSMSMVTSSDYPVAAGPVPAAASRHQEHMGCCGGPSTQLSE